MNKWSDLLKKHVEAKTDCGGLSGELIRKGSDEFMAEMLFHISERRTDDVERELEKAEKFFYTFCEEERNKIEDIIFEKGFLCGEYLTFDKLYEEFVSNSRFDREMNKLMGRAHVKEIVWYLYDHPESRHVEIARDIHIDTSQLSRIMEKLTDSGVVKKYQESKFSYYVLSFEGKRYLENNESGTWDLENRGRRQNMILWKDKIERAMEKDEKESMKLRYVKEDLHLA